MKPPRPADSPAVACTSTGATGSRGPAAGGQGPMLTAGVSAAIGRARTRPESGLFGPFNLWQHSLATRPARTRLPSLRHEPARRDRPMAGAGRPAALGRAGWEAAQDPSGHSCRVSQRSQATQSLREHLTRGAQPCLTIHWPAVPDNKPVMIAFNKAPAQQMHLSFPDASRWHLEEHARLCPGQASWPLGAFCAYQPSWVAEARGRVWSAACTG